MLSDVCFGIFVMYSIFSTDKECTSIEVATDTTNKLPSSASSPFFRVDRSDVERFNRDCNFLKEEVLMSKLRKFQSGPTFLFASRNLAHTQVTHHQGKRTSLLRIESLVN